MWTIVLLVLFHTSSKCKCGQSIPKSNVLTQACNSGRQLEKRSKKSTAPRLSNMHKNILKMWRRGGGGGGAIQC